MNSQYLPVAAMLSFLKRSGCRLFRRPSEALNTLLQAIHSHEHLQLCLDGVFEDTVVMDDFFTYLFRSAPGGIDGDILVDASQLADEGAVGLQIHVRR
jgi:hypothetical protein